MVCKTSSGIQDRDRDLSVPAFTLYAEFYIGQVELGYLIRTISGKRVILYSLLAMSSAIGKPQFCMASQVN